MKARHLRWILVVSIAALALVPADVWSGCGCDHPAPCPASVMPAFASPGDLIEITLPEGSAGQGNQLIEFKKSKMFKKETKTTRLLKTKILKEFMRGQGSGFNSLVQGSASAPGQIEAQVPRSSHAKEKKLVGPVEIKVRGGRDLKDTLAKYEDQFVYLSRPLALEEAQGHYIFLDYPIAVDSSGVLYIPLDLSRIQAAMNFAVYVDNLPLDFEASDVIIYNKDGFNLNLFTLDVEGYEKQWGAWYGAQAYNSPTAKQSDVVTYWRHDFYAYNAAHAPGGPYSAHEKTEDGYLIHPDGSIHVDHDRLIVAISGMLRDPKNPQDVSKMKQLDPGRIVNAEIHVLQLRTDDPFAFERLTPAQSAAVSVIKVGTPYKAGFQTFGDVSNLYKFEFEIFEADWDDDDDDDDD